VPLLGLLERLQPAQSSERPGGLGTAGGGFGPASLLRAMATELGLSEPGVLTMPYRLRIS
jgi:hypothetical protein